ncbi:hypothetical protein V8C43DRAFT_70507 [Trichoderma afarasin]
MFHDEIYNHSSSRTQFHSVGERKKKEDTALAWLLCFLSFCGEKVGGMRMGMGLFFYRLLLFRFWSGRYLNFYLCLLFLLSSISDSVCLFLLVVLTNCVLYDVVACNLLTLSPLFFLFSFLFFSWFHLFLCLEERDGKA